MRNEHGSAGIWIVAVIFLLLLVCICCSGLICAGTFFVGSNFSDYDLESFSGWEVEVDGNPVDPAPTPIPPTLEPEPVEVNGDAEQMLQELTMVVIPEADPIELAMQFYGHDSIPEVAATSAEPIAVGTVQSFWVSNLDSNENFRIDAELMYAREHIYFWVEDGVDVDMSEVRDLVDEFEEDIYPTDRAFFGEEWSPGVDGDPHLYILLAEDIGSSVAGYYASIDEYVSLVHEYSNGHEMFYLSADNVWLGDEFTYGVLAHEFQHMIHWYMDANEETWLNEGFSELAAFLNGYDVGGFDYLYAMDPDIPLTYWPSEPGTSGPHYGQSFLFVTYFLDRFGAEATQALVANPANGLDSVDQVLSELEIANPDTDIYYTADEIFKDFALTLLLLDGSVADGRYEFSNYSGAPQAYVNDEIDQCNGEQFSRQVSQYGIDYISIECTGSFTLDFRGNTLTRVVPEDPHSGEYAFWSNRGDVSNMKLTRSFDLSDVTGPVEISYWVWYDIEVDYDYIYLQVSDDGGGSWSIVQTPGSTAEDPSGNSYGYAYNALSGGGSEARWVQETVDLSSYTGQEILLRFEYVTDAAVHGEGLLLDDLAIEALDYTEDFEAGAGGWLAEGFVRLNNRIPQSYEVVLVLSDGDTQVLSVELDEMQRGSVSFETAGGYQEAVLVVMGTTRFSLQPATYEITIQP